MRRPRLIALQCIALLTVSGLSVGCSEDEPPPVLGTDDVGGVVDENDVGHIDDVAIDDDDTAVQPDVVEEPSGPVDGPGDNCPEISNPDQSDRSRDGVGDACANFPYFHDPTNPEQIPIVLESEGPPNNSHFEATQNWVLDLPFMLEGNIAAPEGGMGDLDYYAFEIDEPQTVLVHLEAVESAIWPLMIINGDFGDGVEYGAVVLAPNRGESEVRDVHLPVAGRYVVAVTDYENLRAGGSPTGGPGYDYRISLSSPPLPEAEAVPSPTPRQVVSYERREPTIFSVDVSGEDALRVVASGAPRNTQSVVLPAVHILDAATGRVLAFTREDQVITDSLRTELSLKLGDQIDRVLVLVEAHTSLGVNDFVVDIEVFDKPRHLATAENPRNSRNESLLWLRPGAQIAAEIGPPRVTSDTALAADENYFLIQTHPGEVLRATVEPHPDSQLVPRLALGDLNFSWFSSWQASEPELQAGQGASVHKLITRNRWRDGGIRVAHRGNQGTSLPVGGPRFAYDLQVERLDPRDIAHQIDSFPAAVEVDLAAGEQGIYRFPFQPGFRYDLSFPGSFTHRLAVVEGSNWEVLETISFDTSTSFVARPDQELFITVRDTGGRPITPEDGLVIEIDQGPGPEAIDLDEVRQGSLDPEDSQKIYRLDVTAGQLFVARVVAPSGGRVGVETIGPISEVGASDDQSLQLFRVTDDGEVLIVVSRLTGNEVDYALRVSPVEPESGQLPLAEATTLQEEVSPRWWTLSLEAGERYIFNAAGSSQGGDHHWLGIFDAQTLERLDDRAGGVAAFRPQQDRDVLVALADPAGPLADSTEVGLAISQATYLDVDGTGQESVEFNDGLHPVLLRFEHPGAGMSLVESLDEDAVVVFADGVTNLIDGQDKPRQIALHAQGMGRHLTAIVAPRRVQSSSWTTQVELVDVDAAAATQLDVDQAITADPLTIEDWPIAYRGDLATGLDTRAFTMELDEGDIIWAIAAPTSSASLSLSAWLRIRDPDGDPQQLAASGGEGNFPAIFAFTVDEAGPWQLHFERLFGEGEFFLYLARQTSGQ